MLTSCSPAISASAPTPTSTWSRTCARMVAPSSASLPISGAGKWSSRVVISTGWRARSPGWRSVRWCCRWSRARPRPMRCAGGSDRRCCSSGCGRRLAAARYWRIWPDNASFAFAAERGTFLTVLHRLFVSGSDRAAEKWRADYRIDGTEGLQLHHLYRAVAWLGEPLTDQTGASRLAPRCRKDLVEEELFARRRDLFAELSVVFMDTTSMSFEGKGGEELGRRGHSKDHRPDLNQMIVGLVMDQDGRPLCSERWPGNTADVTTLLPVVDRLRARFGVGRICVVADRGMISAATIAALEERKLEYVLGVRERSSAEVRRTVIDNQTPFVPLVVPRASGDLTELEAKQVKIGNRRYIVCRNLAEARRDAEQRSAILDGLRAKLAQGDKALVGNSGFRRYLKTVSAEHFAIDEARVADDARFDGLYVLRTNSKITPLQVMLRYRDLLRVEQLLRQAKAVLATRPIYHSSDMAIRGHVFCSFLALLLVKELEDRLRRAWHRRRMGRHPAR